MASYKAMKAQGEEADREGEEQGNQRRQVPMTGLEYKVRLVKAIKYEKDEEKKKMYKEALTQILELEPRAINPLIKNRPHWEMAPADWFRMCAKERRASHSPPPSPRRRRTAPSSCTHAL